MTLRDAQGRFVSPLREKRVAVIEELMRYADKPKRPWYHRLNDWLKGHPK
jgi:hypothetical protein